MVFCGKPEKATLATLQERKRESTAHFSTLLKNASKPEHKRATASKGVEKADNPGHYEPLLKTQILSIQGVAILTRMSALVRKFENVYRFFHLMICGDSLAQ